MGRNRPAAKKSRSCVFFILIIVGVAVNTLPWLWYPSSSQSLDKHNATVSSIANKEAALEPLDDLGESANSTFTWPSDIESTVGRLLRITELISTYDSHRPNRVCFDLELTDAEVKKQLQNSERNGNDALNYVGCSRELHMPSWRRRQYGEKWTMEKNGLVHHPPYEKKKMAYVLMVSNHKYIDGALVMGDSMREHSPLVKSGRAELVILVVEYLHPDSLQELALVFDVVKVMRSLAPLAPRSAYKTTFDKIYLWYLTEYAKVMLLDADHLLHTGDADMYFETPEISKANDIVAVGGSKYFQTALITAIPDLSIFTDLYLEFRFGQGRAGSCKGCQDLVSTASKSLGYGYNQWRARDGILLRNCFLSRGKVFGVDHPNGLRHFSGRVKPWFDPSKPHKVQKGESAEKHDSDFFLWWTRYEELHRTALAFIPLHSRYGEGLAAEDFLPFEVAPESLMNADRHEGKKKGHAQDKGKKKGKHHHTEGQEHTIKAADIPDIMWISRHAGDAQYLRPTLTHSDSMRNVSMEGLKMVVSRESSNCENACQEHDLKCHSNGFNLSVFTSCLMLSSVSLLASKVDVTLLQQSDKSLSSYFTGCSSCLYNDGDQIYNPAVFSSSEKFECSVNPRFSRKFFSNCDAKLATARRLCPCI